MAVPDSSASRTPYDSASRECGECEKHGENRCASSDSERVTEIAGTDGQKRGRKVTAEIEQRVGLGAPSFGHVSADQSEPAKLAKPCAAPASTAVTTMAAIHCACTATSNAAMQATPAVAPVSRMARTSSRFAAN